MRVFALAGLLIAALAVPVAANAGPVQGAVQGTATVAKGAVQGTVQAGQGVARGAGTVARSTWDGVRCVVTLGNRC